MINRGRNGLSEGQTLTSLNRIQEEAWKRSLKRGSRPSTADKGSLVTFNDCVTYLPSFYEERNGSAYLDDVIGHSSEPDPGRLESSFSLGRIGNSLHISDSQEYSMTSRRNVIGLSQGPITSTTRGVVRNNHFSFQNRPPGVIGAGLAPQPSNVNPSNKPSGEIKSHRSKSSIERMPMYDQGLNNASDVKRSASVHHTVNIGQMSSRERQAKTGKKSTNTLSFDNWLDSLPESDSKPDFGATVTISKHRHKDRLVLEEIEDVEVGGIYEDRPLLSSVSSGEAIEMELAGQLKMLMFGSTNRHYADSWQHQALTFNTRPDLLYGLEQERGGPCGVLASVQAHMLKCLIFGKSSFDVNTKAMYPLDPTHEERHRALAVGLAEIILRCANNKKPVYQIAKVGPKKHISSAGRFRTDGVTEYIMLHKFDDKQKMLNFISENLAMFTEKGTSGVVAFVYSVLLTRGLEQVRKDMDCHEGTLLAAHEYCTQELVNLLVSGEAVSNVFNDKIVLGEGKETTVLKGITKESDIGLLSLFEHYKSCQVGSHLKNPLLPIWLVCSESHFTVLFALQTIPQDQGIFDLYYYDGLARQESIIRLTLTVSEEASESHGQYTSEKGGNQPPLELCLRTKWNGAIVNWNGVDPIL